MGPGWGVDVLMASHVRPTAVGTCWPLQVAAAVGAGVRVPRISKPRILFLIQARCLCWVLLGPHTQRQLPSGLVFWAMKLQRCAASLFFYLSKC